MDFPEIYYHANALVFILVLWAACLYVNALRK